MLLSYEYCLLFVFPILNINLYTCAVLGNHDYRGDVLAQLNPILKNIDNRWRCERSFQFDVFDYNLCLSSLRNGMLLN